MQTTSSQSQRATARSLHLLSEETEISVDGHTLWWYKAEKSDMEPSQSACSSAKPGSLAGSARLGRRRPKHPHAIAQRSEQVPRRPAFAGAKLCSAPKVVAFLSELTSSQTGISV